MGIPIELLQAKVEAKAVTKVVLSYYPGAHWDCELLDIQGNRVIVEPDRYWSRLISDAVAMLELRQDENKKP